MGAPHPQFFWFLSELYKEIRIILNILGAAIENMPIPQEERFLHNCNTDIFKAGLRNTKSTQHSQPERYTSAIH